MAKRTNEHASQDPTRRLRVRWVEVELDGADSTIAEALRTVERMRRPAIEAISPTKQIANTSAPKNASDTLAQDPTLFDTDNEDVAGAADNESALGVNGESDAASETRRKKRGEGDSKDRNSKIKLVGDINFVPADKTSLKQLFAEKSPASNMDQILVIGYFLQHTLQTPQIGPGHLLSGLKHVNTSVPKDLKQTIRNMQSQKAWLNFTDIESIRLTTEGDNYVEHELGRADGGTGGG